MYKNKACSSTITIVFSIQHYKCWPSQKHSGEVQRGSPTVLQIEYTIIHHFLLNWSPTWWLSQKHSREVQCGSPTNWIHYHPSLPTYLVPYTVCTSTWYAPLHSLFQLLWPFGSHTMHHSQVNGTSDTWYRVTDHNFDKTCRPFIKTKLDIMILLLAFHSYY